MSRDFVTNYGKFVNKLDEDDEEFIGKSSTQECIVTIEKVSMILTALRC